MSESTTMQKTHAHPHTTYLKKYTSPNFFIDEVNLQVDLYDEHTIVKSKMHVRHSRHSMDQSHDFILNGEELTLETILLNGKPLTQNQFSVTDKFLTIHHVPDTFDLEITVKIYPQKNTALSGLYRVNNTYCTQCEAEGFRRITYYLDHPDILSKFTTTISADAARFPTLLSNGNPIKSGQEKNGRHWVMWEDPFKKPSYLFALVAGDFDLLEDTFTTQSGREVILRIYVDKGFKDQTAHAMYSLKEAMKWDEAAFGREYDLDIYMIVAIGDFNMGAMENKGLNIFNTKYVLAKPETATDDDYIHILSVIGHEYFHNWSGNRVTCRDWFQLSLKEGLTIFRDQSFTEDLLSHAVMRIKDVNYLREAQFPEDAGPLAHPVQPEEYIEINNFYTATIYNKGAEVLRMLQTILGKTLFRKGMDLYFAKFDGEAATIEDFVATMEDVSGIDLKQFRLWYAQAGTPVVKVEDNYDATNKTYTLTISQHTPPTPGQPNKLPLHIPIRMGLLNDKGEPIPLHINDEQPETDKILQLTQTTQRFQFKNVSSKPIPSLLRNFSAPVKLQYPYSDHDLLFLFKHDTDAFNRWEAGQQYAVRTLLHLVRDHQQGKALVLPADWLDTFAYLLDHEPHDKFFLTEILSLPSENYIGEQMDVIDVDAIHAAREFALTNITIFLEKRLIKIYEQYHTTAPYQFTMEEVGKRQLKNLALRYLLTLPQHAKLGDQQFAGALTSNMSDTMPALAGLSNLDIPQRTHALAQFYDTWQKDPLVIDKWFAIQAVTKLPSALNDVKQLVQHPAFDIKNPNKVYALIGAFGNRNPVHFHTKSGNGYEFLREIVSRLDKLNPQVAARMVKPLTTWRRYDKERQKLMRNQLELLLQDKPISTDLYELVTKSL